MRGYVEALEGEDMIPEYNYLVQSANLPNWLRPLVRKLVDKRRAHILNLTRECCSSFFIWILCAVTPTFDV